MMRCFNYRVYLTERLLVQPLGAGAESCPCECPREYTGQPCIFPGAVPQVLNLMGRIMHQASEQRSFYSVSKPIG
jgi:hypothetical protein